MNVITKFPTESLNPIIKSYFIIHSSDFSHDNIPPLGFPVLQFHLKNNVSQYFTDYQLNLSETLIIGQLTKYASLHPVNDTQIIGVNFQATGIHQLTSAVMKQFTDNAKPAKEFFGQSICNLKKILKNAQNHEKQISILDNYFISEIHKKRTVNEKFELLIAEIEQRNGIISLPEMQEIYPASERTLQRIFNKQVGVSPKIFCRILRHLNTFKIIRQNPEISFSQLVFQCGYNDSAHFTKDFKLIAGVTPLEYFSRDEKYASLLAGI